jgi:hypothetical protein
MKTKLSLHQAVKGTNISMIPPAGFTKADNFFGFQQVETNSSIMVVNMACPFSEISEGITKENLLERGVRVSRIENRVIEGMPAIFTDGKQSNNGQTYHKYMLVFGSDTETIIISYACPADFKNLAAAVKKSLRTIRYEVEETTDTQDLLDFTIDASATGLVLGNASGMIMLFTADGHVPAVADDKDMLMVTKSFKEHGLIDQKLFALNRVRNLYSAEVQKIEHIRKIRVDDIAGYEILATVLNPEGELKYVYQVMLFSDALYYIIVGFTDLHNLVRVKGMKKAARTFRRK